MDRTTALNNIDIGGGRRGYRDRNLGAGLPGTLLTAADRIALQEELMAVIEGVGIVPSAAALNQAVAAIKRLAGANSQSITATRALLADDAGLVLANATGGNVTLTLPLAAAANGVPLEYKIRRIDSSLNTVSVALAGANTRYDGSTTVWSIPPGGLLNLMSNGATIWAELAGDGGRLVAVQTFSAAGTYTPTPGIRMAVIEGVGGGGAGGGTQATAAGQAAAGGGGGAGAYGKGLFLAGAIGASQPVTIGLVAIGVIGGNGSNGSTASVGTLISFPGGAGGQVGLSTASFVASTPGGAGGATPSGGTIEAIIGGSGLAGAVYGASNAGPGIGGISRMMGPGNGGAGTGTAQSSPATAGNNGTLSKIIIWEYS